jgi:hypothetical protein
VKVLLGILVLFFAFSAVLFAAEEPKIQEDILMEAAPAPPMEGAMGPDGPQREFFFISAEMEDAGKIVKGAPYSAEAVTERTQNLADGNRIVHKSSTKIYRDSEGRTRREQQFNAIGNWKAAEDPPAVIFIQDPVVDVHYVLEPENQVARKIKLENRAPLPPGHDREEQEFEMAAPHPPGPGHFGAEVIRYKLTEKDAKTESLGKQSMEGIPVEGTRTTMTIPAGEMGNDLPIQVVTEKWYSPELQVNVMTRHSDPRFGETVYQLTHISRSEQDRSLFEVPRGYKIENAPLPPRRIIRREVKKD